MQLSNDDFTDPRALAIKADVLWIAKQQAATAINKVTSQPKGKITTAHATRQNWCFYHKRFGDDAKNCKALCSHPAAPRIATVTTCRDKRARLLYVKDDISGRRFLVDTGALVSVFPASGLDTRSHRPSALLEAANDSTIHTYADKVMTLSINGRKYVWKFIVADVTQPLLGGDFLCSNTLMVDVKVSDWWIQRPIRHYHYKSQMHQLTGSTTLLMTTTFLLSLLNFRTFLHPPSLIQLPSMGSSTTSPLMVLRSTVVHAGFHRRN